MRKKTAKNVYFLYIYTFGHTQNSRIWEGGEGAARTAADRGEGEAARGQDNGKRTSRVGSKIAKI